MKRKYCSTCRHSKYVLDDKQKRRLHCNQRQAFGQSPYIDTDCTDAEECLDYDPENLRSALTTRKNYREAMSRAGIPLEEEADGILCDERLE